jgi:hypothetical protein
MGAGAETLVTFAEGIWLSAEPIVYLGLRVNAVMSVVRLADDTLLVHSPVPLSPARREQVDALGVVGHLLAPNLFHHRWIGDWAAAYPSARVHAPAGLAEKHRGLRVDRTLGAAPEPAFAGVIDEFAIEGFRLRETVLFVRPARALVVADLVQNVGRPTHGWTVAYTRAMGFYDRVALSRVIRWTGFDDRRAARRALGRVLAQDFDRLVVGHGEPLATGGKQALTAAYSWLAPRTDRGAA